MLLGDLVQLLSICVMMWTVVHILSQLLFMKYISFVKYIILQGVLAEPSFLSNSWCLWSFPYLKVWTYELKSQSVSWRGNTRHFIGISLTKKDTHQGVSKTDFSCIFDHIIQPCDAHIPWRKFWGHDSTLIQTVCEQFLV